MKKTLLTLCVFLHTLASSAIYAVEKNSIYIYADEGVSPNALFQSLSTFKKAVNDKYVIKTLNAEEVKKGNWVSDAILFIMPAGADLPFVRKLYGAGNQQIKQYVNEGGAYIGICAGSYYASSFVEFDKNGPLEVIGSRELAFFQGKAIGPIGGPYDYHGHKSSRAEKVLTTFHDLREVTVYYNGGGYFENAERYLNTKILATYENKLPAIISIDYGQGKVILSGVHIEYDPYLLDQNDTDLQKIFKPLKNANEQREMLVRHIINSIGV